MVEDDLTVEQMRRIAKAQQRQPGFAILREMRRREQAQAEANRMLRHMSLLLGAHGVTLGGIAPTIMQQRPVEIIKDVEVEVVEPEQLPAPEGSDD